MEMYKFREFYIRDQMMDSIRNYIDRKIPAGSFLSAVICNDLVSAVSNADDENIKNIPAFASYFYQYAPTSCWGSLEKMKIWLATGVRNESTK